MTIGQAFMLAGWIFIQCAVVVGCYMHSANTDPLLRRDAEIPPENRQPKRKEVER